MSQRVINEISIVKQPGGRIHDDYEGVEYQEIINEGDINKDIYAENYSNKPLYVRVKLTEYYEEGEGAGNYVVESSNNTMQPTSDNKSGILPNSGMDQSSLFDRSTWPPYLPNGLLINGKPSKLREIIQWSLGDVNDSRKIYMPTFNQDNLNLSADVTGEALDELTWKKNLYYDVSTKKLDGTQNQWEIGETHTSTLINNSIDMDSPTEKSEVTHTAKETVTPDFKGYMTMSEWVNSGKKSGNFWVHDIDGWLYWANQLESYTSSSLVLDKLHVALPQNDFFYAINVISEFSTKNDLIHWENKTLNADELLSTIK